MRKVTRVFLKSFSKIRAVVLVVMIFALTASLAMAAKKETTSAGPATISGNRKVEADFIVQIKSSLFWKYTGYATGDAEYFDSNGNQINLQHADVIPFGIITFTYGNGEHRTMRSEMSPTWEMESIGYAPEGQRLKVKKVEDLKPRIWDSATNTIIQYARKSVITAER
ncbi:MAG: hypothetical protein IKX54_05830 [Lachnospiraceae bacterium]|nr:hypothetical protein [Lachnospiraceae bacterium]